VLERHGITAQPTQAEREAEWRLDAIEVLPTAKVREVLREECDASTSTGSRIRLRQAARRLGVDLDATGEDCGCGHTSVSTNNLCMAPVRTAGGSVASCGCSHPSHAMPAKRERQESTYPPEYEATGELTLASQMDRATAGMCEQNGMRPHLFGDVRGERRCLFCEKAG
jgi:hypothetical protein